MLAELKQVSSSVHVRPGYQDSDGHTQWNNPQQEYQQEPAAHFSGQDHSPQVSCQGSHDSLEGRASPQLIYSNGFPTGDTQYMLSQQQEGPSQPGFQLGQHSLDADHSQWATHNRSCLQQHSTDSPHAQSPDKSDGFNRPTSQLQRHSFDGSYLGAQHQGQSTDQHQLFRSQSLTHPPQQAALQRQGMRDCMQQQQQQSMQSRPQSAGGASSGAQDTVRHLQRHSTGQTQSEASPFVTQQLHPHSHSDSQHGVQSPQTSWPHASSQSQYASSQSQYASSQSQYASSQSQYALQSHSQSHPHLPGSTQNSPWDADDRLFQAVPTLPKKKSSGDMSRHGSGSTDGQLSEYVPAESLLVHTCIILLCHAYRQHS